MLSGSPWVFANEPCVPAADSEYEKILCDLKRSGRGSTLPSLREFRKNPPLTQAFLLKKPAARAGISIRMPERSAEETLSRQEALLVALEAEAVVTKPVIIDKVAPVVVAVAPPVLSTPSAPAPIAVLVPAPVPARPVCERQALALLCQGERYALVGNKTNQQLDPSALSEQNTLGMPVYQGDPADTLALQRYLQQAYRHYLDGMLRIGLGAQTMSYTKFANLYDYMTGQRLDFAGRFETMYHFLKADKLAIGVSTRLAIADGFDPATCRPFENLVACNYQKDNYLFVRQP